MLMQKLLLLQENLLRLLAYLAKLGITVHLRE
jgi:hypothetical protein